MNAENNIPEINQGGLGSKREAVLLQVIEDLERQLEDLKVFWEASKNREETLNASVEYWARQWRAVVSDLTDFYEDGTLMAGSRLDDYLIETFDIETTEEVSVTLTITYSGKVTIPKGADLGNLVMESEPDYDVNLELEGDTIGNLTLDGTDYDY